MKFHRVGRSLLGLAVGLTALLTPSAARAQITNLGASDLAPSGVLGTVDYDDKHHVYLHAWEYQNRVWGRFVGANGAVLGISFVISTHVDAAGFAGRPKVAYTRGNSADEFLVLYVSDFNSYNRASNVFGQIVRYTGSGPTAGTMDPGFITVAPYFPNSAITQILDTVVYNPIASKFLVVWEEAPSGYEVVARHIGLDGSPAGDTWNISNMAGSQGVSQAAFDPQNNRYLVAYVGDGGAGFPALAAFAKILNGSTGEPLSNTLLLSGGYCTEPSVTYLPARGGFLITWTAFKPDRTVMARFVASSTTSTVATDAFLALDTLGNDGGASVTYDPVSHWTVIAAMSDPKYIRGALLDANGIPQIPPFVLGTVIPVSGSYYPTVRPAEGGILGLAYVIDYTSAVLERYQLAPAGTTPPPPPPPPTCTLSLSDGSTSIAGGAQVGAVLVTAGAGCNWSASPQAAWLTVSPASGGGSGSLQWTAAANSTGSPRTGTIVVSYSGGNRTLTINQAAFTATAGDFNGDSRVDLVWQNRSTGQLSLWKMSGFTRMTGDPFNPSMVPDTGWKIVATVDIDKDGSADLLWQHDSGYVAVWKMRGTDRLSGELITPTPLSDTQWRIVGAGDIDRDGSPDIVWQHHDGRIAVWYMRGTTYLSGAVIVQSLSDQGWRVAGVADMNRDGNVDILWHHSGTGEMAVWLMNRAQLIDARLLNEACPDTNWNVRGLGDFDGDGDVDVLWQNDVTGGLAAWVMDGVTVQRGVFLDTSVPDTNWKVVGPR